MCIFFRFWSGEHEVHYSMRILKSRFPWARTLISKNKDQKIRQMQNQPAQCLSKHTYTEVRETAEEVEPKCNNNSLVKLQNYENLCFDEQYHLTIPFEDSAQKVSF